MIVITSIKELPENCRECPFCEYRNRSCIQCNALMSRFHPADYEGRHTKCPLKEIDECSTL